MQYLCVIIKIKQAMNKRKFNVLLASSILMLSGSVLCSAHDFSVVDNNGKKYFFNITDSAKKTVEITYEGRITSSDDTFTFEGEVQIPSKVKFRDVVYRVASIGPKAFAGCEGVTGVVIPSGIVEIKDFAFDGCTSLSKIIFPSNTVTMGEGVFFRCPAIENVTLGGDWSAVDLRTFEWSDSLRNVRIPAKVKNIRNLKSLDVLESIEVDVNNSNFTSVDGVLYNKDMTTLYGCPRNRAGEVVVPEGVVSILNGALYDCNKVTSVDLPSTLTTLSYMEFAGMDSLKEICMRAETPVLTSKVGESEVFALKVPKSENVTLYVHKNALKAYKSAVFNESAEYADMNGKNTCKHLPEEMLDKKDIKGVKSFDKE